MAATTTPSNIVPIATTTVAPNATITPPNIAATAAAPSTTTSTSSSKVKSNIQFTIILTKLGHSFTACPGVSADVSNCRTPVDFLSLFLHLT